VGPERIYSPFSTCLAFLIWRFVIYYKRLEQGTFEIPGSKIEGSGIEIRWEELVLILEGISLESVRRRKRFVKSA